jgi:glycosyltransferase involved in cell wall biosynthesis
LPEVGGDAFLYADANDENDIANQLCIFYKDETLRAELIAKTKEQSMKFEWEASAVKFYEVIEKTFKA